MYVFLQDGSLDADEPDQDVDGAASVGEPVAEAAPWREPFWSRLMEAINQKNSVEAAWWAEWVGDEEACMASPGEPVGATAWHLAAAKLLVQPCRDTGAAKTRLVEALGEKAGLQLSVVAIVVAVVALR